MKEKLGIYVHIPFCIEKCYYCDFYSVKLNKELENKYVSCLIKEISNYYENYSKYIVNSIYIGGGTPSIVNVDSIYKIINSINKYFDIDKDVEISIETNPKTLDIEKIKNYKKMSINRFSLGIQSLDDNILKKIGRIHNRADALKSLKMLIDYGFSNINTDIMFNLPDQSLKDVINTLKIILEYDIPHISYYSLKIEKNTPYFNMLENNIIELPDEDIERKMYYEGRDIIEQRDIMQYEISNFSKEGYECRHNLKYWTLKPYIGIGTDAHSFFNNKRYYNHRDIYSYCYNIEMKNEAVVNKKEITFDEKQFEFIFLNLRLTKGLNLLEFNKIFEINFYVNYKDVIDELLEMQLINILDNYIKLTKKGMDVSNYVFLKFMK